MKTRITPLNFAAALLLVMAVYVWLNGATMAGMQYRHLGGTIGWVFLFFALIVSFLDLMLRNFFPGTKNLWIVQLSFITLTAILLLLIK